MKITTESLLLKALDNKDWQVRLAAAQYPNAPKVVRDKAMCDSDERVREAGARNRFVSLHINQDDNKRLKQQARFIRAEAEPRYMDGTTVNGMDYDEQTNPIPFFQNGRWNVTIELSTGKVLDWPEGTTAHVFYKVCDQGQYWLLDEQQQIIAKFDDYGESGNDHIEHGDDRMTYVPDNILCPEESGYGDYIDLNVDASGLVQQWDWDDRRIGTEWKPVLPPLPNLPVEPAEPVKKVPDKKFVGMGM